MLFNTHLQQNSCTFFKMEDWSVAAMFRAMWRREADPASSMLRQDQGYHGEGDSLTYTQNFRYYGIIKIQRKTNMDRSVPKIFQLYRTMKN
jgi:hypothetical protein